ncbi:MAG TPA: protease pro-enzyme activation domain-containing protein, partial [Fimbriimonadaceae bacterium]|nr:protease pro-enzyme activation domain-containing protein [Fimbriimonadaceae bacterium]
MSTIGLAQSAQQTYAPLKMSPPPGFAASRQLTRLSPSKHLSISVSLAYRDPAGIQRFVASVSDPSSPEYRHFISPAEVGKRFGPGPATLAKVEKYLTDSGIKIKLVGDNGLSILADATVAQAESAFKTQIYEYHSLSGYAPATGVLYSYAAIPSIPADIQPAVVEIGGLENFSHPQPASAVTPNQIQTLYDLAPMYSQGAQGQGRTIGISNWDGYRLANVPYEYSRFGLPSPPGGVGSNITVKTISGGAGSGTEQGEGDLDIQAILGVAPLCNLIIYDGGNSDLIGVLTQEANDNQADVISESYGWTLASSTKTAAHNLHLSMSAEGITYMAASGDSGTTLNYYYPDIEPEVLLVGGTTVTVDSSGHRVSETGWSGSGGGWKATTDAFNVLP